MTGDQVLPRPAPAAGSTQATFDAHHAGVLAGAAAQRSAGQGGGVGGFRVDPEGYRIAIDKLTQAVDELEAGQLRWRQHYQSGAAIGIDPVSIQLRKNMDEMQRRAINYVQAYAQQIRDTRDALQAQLASYQAVEQRNTERLA